MSCPRCGSTLAAGAGACPVCDPWATPLRPATALPALTPVPAEAKLPKWIRRAAWRNPPAYADLEKAWRNSVIAGSLTVVIMTFGTATVVADGFAHHSPELWKAFAAVTVLALLVLLGTALVVRKNFWLSRAIAVVGTRPDIGYEGFARLRGIVWITRTTRAFPVLIIVSGCLNVFLIGVNSTLTMMNISYSVYTVLLSCGVALQCVSQARARRELAEALSR
jgi:hypothetical protein